MESILFTDLILYILKVFFRLKESVQTYIIRTSIKEFLIKMKESFANILIVINNLQVFFFYRF